ncbi:MAG: hypothetical protein EOQ44_25085 [Mesorhizobium sp.]|uniref:hypothetical protein n=1 Tax=Mesorhizobium sp. TaxID=1871066 RepID=UPI000FE62FCE|nr:hypothetical protein [Mesorhizobium sp.]RWB40422.1 MAG: hypothetical protein EOQ44_25085 [Mesorhizobium sp.]
MTETLEAQIDRLANFIMAEVPGEPSQSEGAVDTAIRWMRSALASSSAAPSGEAEPVAWRRCNADEPGQWFDVTLDAYTAEVWRTIRTNQIVEPLYATPTRPASPIEQGEVERLIERLRANDILSRGENYEPWIIAPSALRLEAATALAVLQAELNEARTERDEAIDDAKFAERIATKREIDAHAERDAAIARADRAEALTAATAVGVPGMVEGWQTVETAPKDGAFVFLYWPTMSITAYPAVGFHHGDEYGWELANDRDYGEIFPTHWRPMFTPPSPSAQTDGGRG